LKYLKARNLNGVREIASPADDANDDFGEACDRT
jgi:hypothetical protein